MDMEELMREDFDAETEIARILAQATTSETKVGKDRPWANEVAEALRNALESTKGARDEARELMAETEKEASRMAEEHAALAERLRASLAQVATRTEKLDSRLGRVGRAANRLGGKLQIVNREQTMAEEMADMLVHLRAFGMPDALQALPPLFAEESRCKEAARLANKLREIAEDLVSEPKDKKLHVNLRKIRGEVAFETPFSLAVAAENVQTYCYKLETTILGRFEDALQEKEYQTMRDCIETLQELDAQDAAVQRYISSRSVFVNAPTRLGAEEMPPAMGEEVAEQQSSGSMGVAKRRTERVSEAQKKLKRYYDDLLTTMKDEAVTTEEVFPLPVEVMTTLIQRLLEQQVQSSLDSLLTAESSKLEDNRYRMMLILMAYKETIDLASALQELSDPDTDMVRIADSLFGGFREHYLQHETELLEEIGAKQFSLKGMGSARYRGSLVGGETERFHRVSVQDLKQVVEWAKDAIDRCMEIFKLHQALLAHNVLEILTVLLKLTASYLNERLQYALQSCESGSKAISRSRLKTEHDMDFPTQFSKKAEALVNEVAEPLLVAVNNTGECMEILHNFLLEVVTPVVKASTATHTQCRHAFADFIGSMEESVLVALKTGATACSTLLDKVLFFEQRKEDFTPSRRTEMDILEPSQACHSCMHVFIEIRRNAQLLLGEKNGTSFTTEVSLRLHGVLMGHIKRYYFNMAGAVQLKRDTSEYLRTMRELSIEQVIGMYETLATIANLLLVGPDILPTVMENIKLPHEDLMLYLQLRNDYKSVKALLAQSGHIAA